jgi:hypothetical protein
LVEVAVGMPVGVSVGVFVGVLVGVAVGEGRDRSQPVSVVWWRRTDTPAKRAERITLSQRHAIGRAFAVLGVLGP